MKKLFKIILLVVLVIILFFTLTGCKEKTNLNQSKHSIGNFECVGVHRDLSTVPGYLVYLKDIDTNLMYVKYGLGEYASITAYYNKDGKQMKYDEFKKEHLNKYHKEDEE